MRKYFFSAWHNTCIYMSPEDTDSMRKLSFDEVAALFPDVDSKRVINQISDKIGK